MSDATLELKLQRVLAGFTKRANDSMSRAEVQPYMDDLTRELGATANADLKRRVSGVMRILERKIKCEGMRVLGVCAGAAGERERRP